MPVYDYTALDNKGKTITGIIDAESVAVARQKIRNAGNFIVNLQEVAQAAPEKGKRSFSAAFHWFSRVNPGEIAIMTRQLATLIGAGFPLVTALDALIKQLKSSVLQKSIAGIKDAVIEGSSFADALAKYPRIFSAIYTNMVAAGESSGTLEVVLERLADVTEKQEALKNRLITAMIYPVMLLLISLLITAFMLIYVTPKIESMFADLNQVLPLPTQILITSSNLLQTYWWVLVILVVAAVLGIGQMRKTSQGRRRWDQFILRLPLFGHLVRKLAVNRFAQTLGSLLANGVSMLPALGIVENIVGRVPIAEAVSDAAVSVGKGQGLGKSLEAKSVFPEMAIQMIQVGEQSGNLEEMLIKVGDVYEKEVETTTMRLTAMIEPIMVLIMAGMVLFIVLAIALPIFEMNQFIR
jgi:general secretion pathway protein F